MEIVVWHTLGEDGGQKLLELTERFTEEHPDIKVRLERLSNRAESVDGLAVATPDERPDTLLGDPRSLRTLSDTDYLVRPGECVAAGVLTTDGYLEVINATYSLDGELQAVPFNVSTPVLMFDAALFREAGLDPANPPRTLGEVAASSQVIVDSGLAPHGLIAWDGYGPWFVLQFNARLGDLSGTPSNGRLGAPVAEVDLATPSAIDAVTWLRDEVDAGRAVWIDNTNGFDDLLLLVDRYDGGAMTFTTSAAVGDVARIVAAGSFADQEIQPELGVGPLPGPGRGALVGGGAFYLMDSGIPSRVGATATYIDWLTAPENHAEFAAYTGFSPLSESEAALDIVQQAWAEVPQLRVGYDQLVGLAGDPVHAGPAWGAGDPIDDILGATLAEVIELDGDPRTALKAATAQVNQLLSIYNSEIDEP